MELKDLQAHWNQWGKTDPFWAILSDPAKRDGKWDTAAFFKTGEDWMRRVMDYVQSLGVPLNRGRALDFGCGAGRLTQAMCQHFEQCDGVDIAPSMINLAERFNRFGARCRYHLNNASDLRLFANDSFDFVYSIIVLQHMEPQYSGKYVEEFVRVLKPGGLCVFQLPGEVYPAAAGRPPGGNGATEGQAAAAAPLQNGGFKAEVRLHNLPPAVPPDAPPMAPGHQALLEARVKNTGDSVWPARGADGDGGRYRVVLAARWLDAAGRKVVAEDATTVLAHDVRPGEEVRLPLLVTAPNLAGRYVLEADLVQEGVGRFGDKGAGAATAARSHIDVAARASGPGGNGAPAAEPVIQMYGTPKRAVIDRIRRCGGRLVDVREDRLAGEWWLSYSYCVTK